MNSTAQENQTAVADSTTTVNAPKANITYGQFGNGRFSKVMLELYNDAIEHLELKPEHADKVAKQFGIDCGRIDKAGVASVKVGTLKGKAETVSLKATIDTLKGVIPTHSILIAKQIELVKMLKRHGSEDVSVNWIKPIATWVFGEEKE